MTIIPEVFVTEGRFYWHLPVDFVDFISAVYPCNELNGQPTAFHQPTI